MEESVADMFNEAIDGRNLEQYIPATLGPYTHRKISEIDNQPIDLPNARAATQEMRRRLDEVFSHFSDISFQSIQWHSPILIRISYEDALANAPDGAIIDKSKPLEEYLQVNTRYHASAIKEKIEAKYDPLSFPRIYLSLMKHYEQSLGVSGQEAALMTLRLLIEYLPLIGALAQVGKQDTSEVEAGRNAFRSIEGIMPSHIVEIQAIQKRMKISGYKAQAQAMRSIDNAHAGNESSRVVISKEDQEGLVEVIHIQDRPYSQDELQLAARLLAENRYVATSLIVFQQLLIRHAWDYFQAHPERLSQNFEPYNPIFVPVKDDSGLITSFAPNPKILKTMSNNWLPAIARELMTDSPKIPTNQIDPNNLTTRQVSNGIANTDHLYIFTSLLGEFVSTDDAQIIELRGSFSQVCPAKNMFIENGKNILPDIYGYLKRLG